LPDPSHLLLGVVLASCLVTGVSAAPATNAPASSAPPVSSHVRRFKALDADNHTVVLNHNGMITILLGTNEDSQDAARDAGKAMYPFQGRPDFQLVVVVDLRHSLATWVPSIVTAKMRSSLDSEAIALKPYFLKNGNKSNPRTTSYVIPDFSGTICPQLGWTAGSDDLRGILFGVDGREIKRWDKIDDMAKLQDEIRAALQAQVDNEQAKLASAARTPGSKLLHPVYQHPPIVTYTPWPPKSE
jgi:hypothetical protein